MTVATVEHMPSGTDTGYGSVTVYLWDDSGTLVGVTTTVSPTGAFIFTNVPDGDDYVVSFDTNDPRFGGMDMTAVPVGACAACNYSQIDVYSNVSDQDFGLYAAVDYGDLPDAYELTLVADEGAGHITGSLYLGSAVDAEDDGEESDTATGDTNDNGVTPPSGWRAGGTTTIEVIVTGDNGYLVGYIDWNQDGAFDGPNEVIIPGAVVSGTTEITIDVPIDAATSGVVNARFRLYDSTTATYYAPNGLTINGEVEDYQWPAPGPTAVQFLGVSATSLLGWSVLAAALAGISLLLRRRRAIQPAH